MNEERFAFLFPGQGSQYVGMGSTLPEHSPTARKTFEEADDVLGFPLSKLMFEGPAEELVKTKNTQPAILVHSVAVMRLLEEGGIRPAIVAGHSLGEYSAHVCAGSLTFSDALTTVRLRGELMYEAGLRAPGTMAAILGLDPAGIRGLCDAASTAGVVEPANFNSPDQTVISGEVAGVREAMRIARDHGAKRAIPLEVSGAFHSSLMREALPGLGKHLDGLEIAGASIPVVANVDARAVRSPDEIRERLKEQLMRPVLWNDSVRRIAGEGIRRFVEVGPGKVLGRLLRKIDPDLSAASVDTAADVEAFLAAAGGEGEAP
jgi:[acyl-carrier-protein] S-malonyltransferase